MYFSSASHGYRVFYNETCRKRPLKIDKTKVWKPCGILMQVKSTAECSSIMQYVCSALSEYRSWTPILVFFWVTA